eukprot:COSAG02_NODE_662_length_18752_cov_10.146464_15_plen_272_part_00
MAAVGQSPGGDDIVTFVVCSTWDCLDGPGIDQKFEIWANTSTPEGRDVLRLANEQLTAMERHPSWVPRTPIICSKPQKGPGPAGASGLKNREHDWHCRPDVKNCIFLFCVTPWSVPGQFFTRGVVYTRIGRSFATRTRSAAAVLVCSMRYRSATSAGTSARGRHTFTAARGVRRWATYRRTAAISCTFFPTRQSALPFRCPPALLGAANAVRAAHVDSRRRIDPQVRARARGEQARSARREHHKSPSTLWACEIAQAARRLFRGRVPPAIR